MIHAGPIAGNWSSKTIDRPFDHILERELEIARSDEPIEGDYSQILRAISQGWPASDDGAVIAKFRADEAAMIVLVKAMWPAISAVASELMIVKTIDGDRLKQIARRFFAVDQILKENVRAFTN